MLTILLHSSKTTRHPSRERAVAGQAPLLIADTERLATRLKALSPSQIQEAMKLSAPMALKTYDLLQNWSKTAPTLPAIDLFLGDIYSGLQVQAFTQQDRDYANRHLFILSGLYGILRALDEVQPYRLEMGYKLPEITNLYQFWGDRIARQLPRNQSMINLSAVEYTKAIFPSMKQIDGLKGVKIISPKFLTISAKTGEPTFVTVHAKVARGAFARWLIQHRIEDEAQLKNFAEIGYIYSPELSTEKEPVFVAQEFKGIGLSVRLT